MQPLSLKRLNFLPDRLCLGMMFDAQQLQAELPLMPEEAWIEHFIPDNYEGNWAILPLRCKRGATHPVMMAYSDPSATEFEATPWLKLAPYLQSILAKLGCPLETVRLMRLKPGSAIKQHCDHDLSADQGKARLHVPITTNAMVDFRLNGIRVTMEAGSLWYLRLSDPHSVRNDGICDRVHLVIDCQVNDWLAERLIAAGCRHKENMPVQPYPAARESR